MTTENDPQASLISELREQLAQSQSELSNFRRAFEQAPAMIASLQGPEHVFQFANAQYMAVVAPGREILGMPVRKALPELAGQGIYELLDEVYRTGVPFLGKEILLHLDRDGTGETTPVYFDFIYQPMRNAEGAIYGLLAHAVEVTDKVLAKAALQDENERTEAEVARRTHELATQKAFAESIIQNVPAGVAWLDKDWVFRVVNTAYAEGFMKAPREKFLDRYLFDALPGTEPQIAHLVRRVFQTGEPHYETAFPFVYLHEGQHVTSYWDFVYYPSFGEDGRTVEGFFILANEVSQRVEQDRERTRLQEERIEALEQADELKDQFLSILSHELRTPINAIMGFGSVLDDQVLGPLSEAQRRYTQKILTSSDALLALIDDLLVVSTVQAGKFSVAPERTDFTASLTRAIETLAPEAEQKAIAVVNAVPSDLPPLLADPQRLTQVLMNLVGNAIKFTPRGGSITVRASIEGEALRCEVSDTGAGIAAEDLSRLFRRFSQLDSTNTRSHKGTGLGLSIVKTIVEAHGGQVGVDSQPGGGSTFWFTLPLGDRSSALEV